MFRHRISAFVTAAVILGATAAHAEGLPADIEASKTVRVALNAAYPPMETIDTATNKPAGFDIDLGEALAKVLGVKLEWQDGAFEQMTPSLQSGRADMILSGFYDTPKRRPMFTFIDYLKAGAQFYTPKDSGLKTLTDLCGKTVTTTRGTSYPDTIKAWSEKNCPAGSSITVIVDTDLGQQLSNLKTERAVAAVQGLEAVPTIIAMDDNGYVPLGEPFSSALMGMAFSGENTQLRDAFKGALAKVIADGTYDQLIKKYKLDLSAYKDMTVDAGPQP